MKDFLTFLHKEIIELIRTGKGLILLGVFVLLGMMNPFIAMSSLFAHEYEKGTLIPFVTKGVSKLSIFMAKEIIIPKI